MKIYTANRETGDYIEEVASIEEGKVQIELYETEDKQNDVFEPDFYDIVNEKHESLI